jgi:mannonate dehydratase
MEISLRLSELSHEELKFIGQIGVERVDIHNPLLIPGYNERGETYYKSIPRVIKKIRDYGIEVASFRFPMIRNALLGRTEGEKEIDTLCRVIKILGSNDAGLIQIDTHSPRLSPRGVPGRFDKEQRSGYLMSAFSLKKMREVLSEINMESPYYHHIKDKIEREVYERNLTALYERIIPILEESNVFLAIHTDDPPVPDAEGLLPGITNLDQIQWILNAVPSPNSGVLFCTGTRYESGVDIYQQIETLGPKIFHIHFRNVKGTLPSNYEYEEVMLDDGDMDMLKVVRALDKAGYERALNPDHDAILIQDTPNRNAARAFSVGYIRALLSAL